MRAWRGLIEYRRTMMGRRASVKNQIRALLRGLGIVTPKGLWTKKGLVWLKSQELGEADGLRREVMVEELEQWQQKIKRVQKALLEIANRHPQVALLRTIPGVGIRTAEAFVAYVDEVKRFARTSQVGSYFGLVPCQDSSAEVNRLGHITRDGPATVRGLLCEAAWQGVLRSPTIRGFYQRVMRNDPERRKIALVAVAHYLVRVMTAMLRTGEAGRESVTAEPTAVAKGCDRPGGDDGFIALGPPATTSRRRSAEDRGTPPVPSGAAAALGSLPSVALSSAAVPVGYQESVGRKAINPAADARR